jgi:ABC-type nitrate/sulfonate/bicarbonate transport system substrate-binding protein
VLAANGLDPDRDVELIGLNERYPQVVDLFGSGDLDAAVLSEPNVSIGEDGGAFKVWRALTDAQFCPTMQWTVVVAGERTRTAEPELVRAVLRASQRSYRWCDEHPDEWTAFIARRLGIPRATAARSIERERPDLHYDCRPDLAGLELAIELQLRLGAFEKRLSLAAITDLSFLPQEASCATS